MVGNGLVSSELAYAIDNESGDQSMPTLHGSVAIAARGPIWRVAVSNGAIYSVVPRLPNTL